MSIWEAIIFGMVQGITEFLPISSTAHIVIATYLLGFQFPGLAFEIFLHQASLLAVVLYFRKDLWELVSGCVRFVFTRSPEDRVHWMFGLYIVVATLITGVLGYTLQKNMGDALKSPVVVAIALAVTGTFLILIERVRHYGTTDEKGMKWHHAIWVGLGQTVAVLPGISRSGATLVTSLWTGLNRETAVRYSFLLAIPIILGSSVLAIPDFQEGLVGTAGFWPLLLAFAVTFVCSWLGIVWLISFLRRSRLIYFAFYCFLLAGFVFFYFDPETVFDAEPAPAKVLDEGSR